MTTVLEAKLWLGTRLDKGASCPCCGQFAKMYLRKLTAPSASVLISMYHLREAWVHVPSLRATEKGGDATKARYWNLIEEMDARRDDGSTRVGYWRLTETGKAFVRGEVRIALHAKVYNGVCLGLDYSRTVDITEALGNKFDYAELMTGT